MYIYLWQIDTPPIEHRSAKPLHKISFRYSTVHNCPWQTDPPSYQA